MTANAAEMWPVQGDVSAFWQVQTKDGAHAGRGGAAWLGYAFWLDQQSPESAFFSTGIEGTIADPATGSPHAWTVGAGTRMGWGVRESKKHPLGNPDFYAYGRVTPFLARGYDDATHGERFGGGLRLGLGFTAPGWTRLLARGATEGGAGDCDGTGTICDVIIAAYIVAMFTNHFEVYVETFGFERDRLSTRIGLRVGAGF